MTRVAPNQRRFDLAKMFPQHCDDQISCLNCDARGLRLFYSVAQIPTHSCLLMHSRDAALSYQRGDLCLGFCPRCGFVTNTRFDIANNDYSTEYEETQAFSPTFNTFAKGLAQELVERHTLHGKRILEIGCGKGEFLVLMCELGKCWGIGIDPGYRPERTTSEAASRITFINDLYDERYAHLDADFVVCRHTLEHIAPTLKFLRCLRRNIGNRTDTLVFFELPDVMRVLREGAFWDIYYEHCTYFTAGSLARLFRKAGFDVLELTPAYDDQYILITTRPQDEPTEPRFEQEDDLAETTRYVERFQEVAGTTITNWRNEINGRAAAGERVVLWGSGSKGVAFLTTLQITDDIRFVVDINPHKHGKFMPGTGQQIVEPSFLKSLRPDLVIAMNPVYLDEIAMDMKAMGVTAKLVAV